ncbi:MAG: Fic family protein [Candidatus Saganbacteria bacterium]|nr:Fic family protein [Candidatus Saganbacteria bacterium]
MAHSSTSIEGNPLSLAQVKALEQGEQLKIPLHYEKEITNYLKALCWIEKHSQSQITESALFLLHKMLMQELLPNQKTGSYKTKQNYVVNENRIRIYTPPTPKQTPKLMHELLEWLNSSKTKILHGVIVGAIFHHRFVSIHPFSDGNGRVARAVGAWIIYQWGIDTNHILSLDDFFASNRKYYYEKIQQTRELDNNLTHWVEYVAEGIVATLGKTKKRIEELQVSSKCTLTLSPRQEELIKTLKDRPLIGVKELQKTMGLTRSRINQIIVPLIKNKLVTKEGQNKSTRYKLCLD